MIFPTGLCIQYLKAFKSFSIKSKSPFAIRAYVHTNNFANTNGMPYGIVVCQKYLKNFKMLNSIEGAVFHENIRMRIFEFIEQVAWKKID